MSRLKTTLLLLTICTTLNLSAQPQANTLAKQYEDVITKSGSYNGFKEIRQEKLNSFWKNISDTLQRERQLLREANAKIAEGSGTVKNAKSEASILQKQLEESEARVSQVSFLGIYLEKSTYNIIMWGLVLLLGAALGFSIYRTGAATKEARYRSGLYNDLSDDFQKLKANANEKEKKLARELQTERNRIAEITAR